MKLVRRRASCFLAAMSIASACVAAPATQPSTRPVSFHKTISKAVGYECLIWLPSAYGEPGKKFPLLIFLHGSGECGRDLSKLTKSGPGPVMMNREVPELEFV